MKIIIITATSIAGDSVAVTGKPITVDDIVGKQLVEANKARLVVVSADLKTTTPKPEPSAPIRRPRLFHFRGKK